MQAESTFTSCLWGPEDEIKTWNRGDEKREGRVMSENNTHRAPDNISRIQSQCNKKVKSRIYLGSNNVFSCRNV